jgi:hypothetical protein
MNLPYPPEDLPQSFTIHTEDGQFHSFERVGNEWCPIPEIIPMKVGPKSWCAGIPAVPGLYGYGQTKKAAVKECWELHRSAVLGWN